MNRWLLDTSALLALRDDEDGAEQVADMLAQTQRGEARCFGCFITLMEVYYRVWKDEGEPAGKLAYAQCRALPIEWLHESPELLQAAARDYPLRMHGSPPPPNWKAPRWYIRTRSLSQSR
jgi:predicted nucleic acid-binding protein